MTSGSERGRSGPVRACWGGVWGGGTLAAAALPAPGGAGPAVSLGGVPRGARLPAILRSVLRGAGRPGRAWRRRARDGNSRAGAAPGAGRPRVALAAGACIVTLACPPAAAAASPATATVGPAER